MLLLGIALGVGKSSLIGDAMLGLAMGACGGARRTDTCGASSIMVLRMLPLRTGAEAALLEVAISVKVWVY